jgi:hypothetical protein
MSSSTTQFVLALFLLVCTFEARSECNEQSWCKNNLKPSEDGTEHSNCENWTKDCPCTCAESLAKLKDKPVVAPEDRDEHWNRDLVESDIEGTCTAESTRIGDTIYLLYDVYYGERFNFRKSLIRRVGSTLDMLEQYTDYKWVLVLPPFRESFAGTSEFSAWSEYFDMDRLKEHKPNIMEYGEYMQQAGDVIDVVIRKEDKETCGEKMEKYDVRKDGDKWQLMGRKVTIKEFVCAPGKGKFKVISARSRGLLDMVVAAVEGGATSVMIDDFREISPSHDIRAPYWEWRQHLYFAEELQSEATRFLAPFEKEGYVAMHMRRTDFVTGHKKTYSR